MALRTRKPSSREYCKSSEFQEAPWYELQLANETGSTLFSRALAELKYLGMVKNSLKKADHLAKLL